MYAAQSHAHVIMFYNYFLLYIGITRGAIHYTHQKQVHREKRVSLQVSRKMFWVRFAIAPELENSKRTGRAVQNAPEV